jgi:hypothetical protein
VVRHGRSSILGLLFEINADPSKAADALQAFEKSTGKSFERAADGTKPLDTALLSNRESVRLLSEELGVHMPRAVSGALAEMMPGISAIGPALLGAFAIAEIPKFIDKVHEAEDAIGGYSKAVKEAEQADSAASNAALTHFKTIGEGYKLIAETNRSLAQLAKEQMGWSMQGTAAAETMNHSWWNLLPVLGPLISLHAAYGASIKVTNDAKDKEAQLNQRLIEQLNQLGHLEDESHKKAKGDTNRDEAEKTRLRMEQIRAMQEAGRVLKQLREDEEKENKTLYEYGQFMEKMMRQDMAWLPLQQRGIEMARQEAQVFSVDTTAVKHLSAAYSEYLLLKQDATNVSRAFMAATKDEVQAVNDDMLGSMKNLAEGAIALTGSQKAAAAFKVGYEIAEGIACLASGTWPPNPAAIVAAGLHFEAAAQYGLMSGRGSRSHPSVGGAGSYGSGSGEYGGGSMPSLPQTLAPGAAGAGGRFGGTARVVVFGTDHELQNWVASAVNGAVHRGVTVHATSSQRGAPVGH